jgi:hypothetical protein
LLFSFLRGYVFLTLSVNYRATITDEFDTRTKIIMPWAGFVKPNINMSDFKTRLVDEQAQLEERLNKLDGFLQSDKVLLIEDTQQALLKVQATAMNTYLQCLKERIERL